MKAVRKQERRFPNRRSGTKRKAVSEMFSRTVVHAIFPQRPLGDKEIAAPFHLLLLPAFAFANPEPTALLDAFPEHGTSRYISGELAMVDHVNRMGILRDDRTDDQNKYHQDLPHHFAMLPYGMAYRCGAPAALKHIPLGTHLHGQFHIGPEGGYRVNLQVTNYNAQVKNSPNSFSPDSQYSHAIRLEDDFSFFQRQGASWKIVSVDRETQKVVAQRISRDTAGDEGLSGKQTFDFNPATRVWKGQGIADVSDLAPGQDILFNLTWATLYGPGRLKEVWIGKEAQDLATRLQDTTFHEYQHLRGFGARVLYVEHIGQTQGVVRAAFYQGFRERDLEQFKPDNTGSCIVVEPNLRAHDQGNDAISARFKAFPKIDNPPPGHSGYEVEFHTYQLLEGIRPGLSIRLQPAGAPRITLPREERISPFDIRPRFLEVHPPKDE
jgi:hypothetical protein